MEARASAGAGRPVKGILKNRSGSGTGQGLADPLALPQAPPLPPAGAPLQAQSSTESRGEEHGKKTQKWDEMNILATYHPAGKDYGLMKIDEPSTPYHSLKEEDAGSDAEDSPVPTADVLAQKLAAAAAGQGPKILAKQDDSSEEEDEVDLTPEELEKKRQFEMKRKMHYNEAQNIKLARQLIAKEMHGEAAADEEDEDEDDDNDDDDEMQDACNTGRMSTESDAAACQKQSVSFCISFH
ncbi:protein phosphatase inhibitor 2 isoform X2 [Candoia aspera]|uniref:protein phosphatase inhibitor 2 isoform X2 n=1 Tax=Candoia aspera TaxID=51853 RepID=UPI002FD85A83